MKDAPKVCSFLSIVVAFFLSGHHWIVLATEGDAQWAKTTVIGPHNSLFYDVAVDSSGNIFTVGNIRSTSQYNFGDGVTVTSGCVGNCPLMVKYNSSGVAQWAKTVISSSIQGIFRGVAVDSSGNVYAVGEIFGNGTYDFGNSITATANQDSVNNFVIVKYNTSGVAQWAKTTITGGAFMDSRFYGVSVDSSGNAYAAGQIEGDGNAFNFGNSVTLTPSTGNQHLLVSYNSDSTTRWAKTAIGQNDGHRYRDVHVDALDNVYAVGIISVGTYDFGDSVTATGVYGDALVVKYNANGSPSWAKTIVTASNSSEYYSVDTDSSGNVFIAGLLSGVNQFDFGNSITAIGAASTNPILIKYNTLGVAQWAKTNTSGAVSADFEGVALDSLGNIYTVGFINNGTINLGNSVTATGTSSISTMLVQYNSSGVAQWAKNPTTAPDFITFVNVAVDTSDNIYAVGEMDSSSTFNFGNSVTAAGGYASKNIIIVQYDGAPAPTLTPTPTSAQSTSSSTGSTSGNSPEFPQITAGAAGIATPVKDSNTGGQAVVTIFQSDTFDFNAFLSAKRDVTESVKVALVKTGYDLIGYIEHIWYKAYAPNGDSHAIIIPELQEKPSIIALSYASFPIDNHNPNTFKLAYSLDGMKWIVQPSSVVDTKNKTVAAIQKIGGYYAIVSANQSQTEEEPEVSILMLTPEPTSMTESLPTVSEISESQKICFFWWCW